MKEFEILYGTTVKETIKAANMLNAQKSAHKRAAVLKTIVISVNEI